MAARVEFSVPYFDCEVLDLAGEGDAGVVEQDVEAAVGFQDSVDDLGPVLFGCDVQVEVAGVVAVGAQGGGGAFTQVVSDVG